MQFDAKGALGNSEKYANYTQNNTIEEVNIVEAPYHSTLCTLCQTVCHDHCGLDEMATPGTLYLMG